MQNLVKKNKDRWYRWNHSELKDTDNYFAIVTDTDLYDPIFPQNSLLIVSAEVELLDRSYLVVKKSNTTRGVIKKYVLDGEDEYLYPLDKGLSIQRFDKNEFILHGIILEVHQKFF